MAQRESYKHKRIGKHMCCRKCTEWDIAENKCTLHHIDHLTDDHVVCIDFNEVKLEDLWYDEDKYFGDSDNG